MKLELKHLVPYLPYGLKFYWERLDGKQNKPWTLTINSLQEALELQNKPILRPLSDLTKEIEHNGEKFVPIEKLNELYGYKEVVLTHYINSGLGWRISSSFGNTAISFDDMYLPVQKLLEWHFDIFGLIPNDLAVDFNSL